MTAPNRADLVLHRQQTVGVVGHISHAEVVTDKACDQYGEGEANEDELPHYHGDRGFPKACKNWQMTEQPGAGRR